MLIDSPIFIFYQFADIEIFNSHDGFLKPLEHADLEMVENIGGNDVIIRTVTKPNEMFEKIEDSFSLIIHNPNDTYNRMLNRLVVEVDDSDGSIEEPKIFKDIHEVSMQKQ